MAVSVRILATSVREIVFSVVIAYLLDFKKFRGCMSRLAGYTRKNLIIDVQMMNNRRGDYSWESIDFSQV